MSKGSKRRPSNDDAFRANHERVFGARELKVWVPDERINALDHACEIDRIVKSMGMPVRVCEAMPDNAIAVESQDKIVGCRAGGPVVEVEKK